jgi:hypothetical protein
MFKLCRRTCCWRINGLIGTGTSWTFVKRWLGVLRVIVEDAAVLSLRISGS